MGTSNTKNKFDELNQIILNAMVENNMACNQSAVQKQEACLSGTTIGFYQSQTGSMSSNCEMDTQLVGKVQQSVTQKLIQQSQADSKMLVPSSSGSKSNVEIQNIIEANLTAENIAQINNNLYQDQSVSTCSGKSTTIGFVQKQSLDAQLKAVSSVMLKTSIYTDLYGNAQQSSESSATFIGFGVFFILIIGIIFVAFFGSQVATDPNTGKNVSQVAPLFIAA